MKIVLLFTIVLFFILGCKDNYYESQPHKKIKQQKLNETKTIYAKYELFPGKPYNKDIWIYEFKDYYIISNYNDIEIIKKEK